MEIKATAPGPQNDLARRPRPTLAPAVPRDAVTLSDGDGPDSAQVRLSFNPQDPMAMTSGEASLPVSETGTTLEGPRIRMADGATQAPDADGNFLFAQGTRGFQQSNSYACTDQTLHLFEQGVGHDIPWAFTGKLAVHPHAGDDFNAYYTRSDGSTNFYDGHDPVMGKTIHASESLDVVSHETGHAVLDGMKPGLLGWFGGTEAEAFHESFGDVAAMLTALHDDRVLDRLVAQTGGDLHRDNIVAHLAEELSQGINDVAFDGKKPAGWTIRNANNALHYENPSHLPSKPDDDAQLGKEPHNFSRLFTGAAWDVMAGLADGYRAQGQSPRDAVALARDVMLPLYAHMVELGPERLKKYRQMADAMLTADARYFNNAHKALITKVFDQRGIRPGSDEASAAVPDVRLDQVPVTLGDAAAVLAAQRRALGVPDGVPLSPQALWRNGRGETFVRYAYVQEVAVGPRTSTDLEGCLTLGFDAAGQLFHRLYEPIDGEQMALAADAIAYHVEQSEIRGTAPRSLSDLLDGAGHPYSGYVLRENGHQKLIRVPATN